MIEATCNIKGKTSSERRFFISNLLPNARQIAQAVRAHWMIESAPQAHKVATKGFVVKCCKAVGKMVVGPPKSAIRSRLQTTSSGCY